MTPPRVAVIGGGPAGCAAAQALREVGCSVQLFEQTAELGGRTWTYRDGPDHLDTGAGFITNFYPRVWALAKTHGFASEVRELNRVTGLHNGRQLARLDVSSPLSFLLFPLISLVDKLQMAWWTLRLTFQRSELDLALPDRLARRDTRSIAEMADQDLSPAIYHHLVRPGIEPFWYFACEDVSAALAETLTAHAAGARFYYVAGGIDRICHAMLDGVTVTTGVSATRVEVSGGKVQLSLSSPSGPSVHEFDKVVIATTASVANRLTQELPETVIPWALRGFLQSQTYAANIHVAFRMPRFPQPLGLNSIFPTGPGAHPLAALSFHRPKDGDKPTHHELVSVYLSDVESRRVMQWSDADLARHAWTLSRSICAVLPEAVPPVLHVNRRPEAIPVHGVGRYQQAVAFQQAQAQSGRTIFFAGDYLATATIDGAIATGRAAAEAMMVPQR